MNIELTKSQWLGPWQSISFTLLIVFINWGTWIILQTILQIMHPASFPLRLELNSNFMFAISLIISTAIGFGIIFLLIRARSNSVKTYLALQTLSWQSAAIWLSIAVICLSFLIALQGRALVLLTYSIIYPIFVEIVIRGFLYKGLEKSTHSPTLPIVVSTLVWFFTYGNFSAIMISFLAGGFAMAIAQTHSTIAAILIYCRLILIQFSLGLILGFIRFRTKSLYPCIIIVVFLSIVSAFLPEAFVINFSNAQYFSMIPTFVFKSFHNMWLFSSH